MCRNGDVMLHHHGDGAVSYSCTMLRYWTTLSMHCFVTMTTTTLHGAAAVPRGVLGKDQPKFGEEVHGRGCRWLSPGGASERLRRQSLKVGEFLLKAG